VTRPTFVEQLPGLTRRHSRWTERLRSTLAAVALALADRAGATSSWANLPVLDVVADAGRRNATACTGRSAEGVVGDRSRTCGVTLIARLQVAWPGPLLLSVASLPKRGILVGLDAQHRSDVMVRRFFNSKV
jgi:hypothetical protein